MEEIKNFKDQALLVAKEPSWIVKEVACQIYLLRLVTSDQ